MATFIDSSITFGIICVLMLIGVLASAIYEKWQERSRK